MSIQEQLFFILDGHEPVPCNDREKFAEFMSPDNFNNRLVAKTVYEKPGNKKIIVSTVFLGVDHSACSSEERQLFETMVFRDGEDEVMDRYATWDEAELGHQKILYMLEEGQSWQNLMVGHKENP